MKTRSMRICSALLIMVLLTTGTIWPVAAREAQPEAVGSSVMLRLKFATFDPLQGEPQMPPALHADAYRGAGEGAYIVQFKGPIQKAWTDQVRALGGRVMDYLPDFAYLVWMDGATQKQVAALDTVRWVGLYQPAYKLSPNLDRTKPIYRVVLFENADLGAVSARLADLNTPTRQVAGEQFVLFLPEGDIEEVAKWPEVLWIENRPFYRLSNDVATGILGASTAWSNGYTGTGQIVTVADSGIDTGTDTTAVGDIHADFDNRMAHISSWPLIDDGCSGCCWSNVGANDGAADVDSGHGTHVLGSVLGNGAASSNQIRGSAYTAIPTFQAVEQWVDFTTWCTLNYGYTDGYYILGLPDDIKTLFQEAYNWGSRIHSNSWGAPVRGEYTDDSQAVDRFVWDHPDMLIVFSAGNMGTDKNPKDGYVDIDSLDAPGTAKNALTVGASDNVRSSGGYNPGGVCSTWYTCWPNDFQVNPTRDDRLSDSSVEMAAFSSRGPTDDGRRKPDVLAPGTNILSTRSSVASGTGWGTYNQYYLYMGGTSMATPLAAGTAALVRQYYVSGLGHTTPSAALLKATLINSAVDITGYGVASQEAGLPIPNHHEGWGRVNVGAATSGGREFVDGVSVATGQTKSYTYDVGSSATPFKVTLAWSDYPASVPSGGLVDDLDLVVTAPDGTTTYRGNVFSGGWSVTGGSADRVNNVESVYIQNPAVGEWTVRVTGYSVGASGGNQPFAFVATGQFGPPPATLAVDHAAGAPGSYFVFTGQNFAPSSDATISVNGTVLAGTVPTDGTGGLEFALHTAPTMSPGTYFVTASTGTAASTFFKLDPGATQWPDPTIDPTIEVPATIDPASRTHLPLIMRQYSPPVPDDPTVNGDFEAGAGVGWSEYSLQALPIVMNSGFLITPHSGTWLAWLGGYSYEIAFMEQTITVPSDRFYLHYWHWRESSASNCALDHASLRVNGALAATYDLCISTNTSGWVEDAVNLSLYAGQTITLQFRAETSWPASSWYVDDVSFEVSATTADASAPRTSDAEFPPARKVKTAPDSLQP